MKRTTVILLKLLYILILLVLVIVSLYYLNKLNTINIPINGDSWISVKLQNPCKESIDYKTISCSPEENVQTGIYLLTDDAKAWICDLPKDSPICKSILIETAKKKVSLFWNAWYKTDAINAYWRNNIDNIHLSFSWKYQDIKLTFTAQIKTRYGDPIKLETSAIFFPMFRFPGWTEVLSALWTDRLANWNIDNDESQPWIIRSTDMPKTLEFDLSKLKLAYWKQINPWLWSYTKNYITVINNRNKNTLPMTLYMLSDGKSLYNSDNNKWIDVFITEAYIEYICDQKTPKCEIKAR